MERDEEVAPPLFETKTTRGRIAYRVYVGSMLMGICLVLVYRVTHIPSSSEGGGRWAWIGMFAAEVWFGFYWIITQSVRWNPVYRYTFKDRLKLRYEAAQLPSVDVFVCTADPTVEPPALVICTVLSIMAYDYPPHKLAVYLSDDGGSELTFYALLEASRFAKHWILFCKKFKVERTSPAAYFSVVDPPLDASLADEWLAVKREYEEMRDRIESVVELGRVPEVIKEEHKGFSEWNSNTTPRNHPAIVQILIDGRSGDDGDGLPTLVYVSREKRPHRHHNFKAGAMNALIRVSSEISGGPIILNVDCDMYSNNSASVRDALCFFMDEKRGDEIAFVQHPQLYDNVTKNDLYGNAFNVINNVELHGLDSLGGPLYIGTGCFHRRECLLGKEYIVGHTEKLQKADQKKIKSDESISRLEDRSKAVATCTYEDNTQWGKEVGLKYGCVVEDVITGLAIQCRGWKSICFDPTRGAFLGVAPMTLAQTLVQHKRWSEGNFHIFLSKYCSFHYGRGKIKLGLQMGYCIYGLWAPNCLSTLYYVVVPSLCLVQGITLFPSISDFWFIPFGYLIIMKNTYSLLESLWSNDTLAGWWNIQRMWVWKRITSYLFGFLDVVLKHLGFSKSAFVITAKVVDEEVMKKHKQEIIEFGGCPPMFMTIIATLALLNLLSLIGGVRRVVVEGDRVVVMEKLFLQLLLSGVLVVINFPVYNAMLSHKDRASIGGSVICTSLALAIFACLLPIF